jgi:chromosome segregation ATPase
MVEMQSSITLFNSKLGSTTERINDPCIMEKLLATLEPREEQIVRLRIGGPEGRAQTQQTIATMVGLSPSSIGQIEAKAYRRMRWVMNNFGTDTAVLDALIAKRKADRAREEEIAASELYAAARKQDQKRIDARQRSERRRAKARKRAWERQLRRAEEQHQNLNDEAAHLSQRMIALEQRGWLVRTLFPRNSEIGRLRARARECEIEIAEADARIAKLRSSPPEGPELAD